MFKKLFYLGCLFLLVSLAANNASAELVGWWKFDGDLVDSSGNDNITTPVGNPAFVEGMLGQAISLNSETTEDYINCGPNMGFSTIGAGGEADGLSIAVWVNRTVEGDDHKICSNLSTAGWGAGEGLQLAIFRNRTELDMRDSTGRFFSRDVDATSFTEMELNTWYHLVFVFDDVADTLTEYVDGVKTYTMEGVPTSLAVSPVDFLIGSQQPTFNATRVFRGMMDDFRLYSNAINEEEVQAIVQGGAAAAPTAGFVVENPDELMGFEPQMQARLESLGYAVELIRGDDVKDGVFTVADAEALDVMVVSEAISSSDVTSLAGADVPMMNGEGFGWHKMNYAENGTQNWQAANVPADVVNDTHPIVANSGLSVGTIGFLLDENAQTTTAQVSMLAPGAVSLVSMVIDGNDYSLVFAIDRGAELAKGAGPAISRIVGFSLPGGENATYVLSDDGWALFDAAIAWLDAVDVPQAAMVVNPGDLSSGFDQAQYDRLVSMGYEVTVVPQGDVGSAFTIADADTYDLLLVSESISSSGADPLIGTITPTMHNESFGWDNWYLTTNTSAGWQSGSEVNIVNATHPIAVDAGVDTGPLAFYSTSDAWTTELVSALAPGAELIAQITVDSTDYAIIFTIDKGAELANGNPAPARIAGFSITGSTTYDASGMTDEAWALWDATIRWLNPAPVESIDPGADGLLVYYPLDNDASDASGNGNDGVIGGDPQFVDGVLQLDGGDSITLPADAMGMRSDVGSVSFWINTGVPSGINTIFWAGDNTTGGGFGPENEMHIHLEGPGGTIWMGGELSFFILANPNVHLHSDPEKGIPPGNDYVNPLLLGDNQWHNVVVVWDGINDIASMYVDGVLINSGPYTTTDYELTNMYLGQMANGGRTYSGLLDNVYIYNRALSEAEVLYLAGM